MTQPEAIRSLVSALNHVIKTIESEEMKSAFTIAHTHGFRYDGPIIHTKEMRILIAEALKTVEPAD